jgi:hypothetical protein
MVVNGSGGRRAGRLVGVVVLLAALVAVASLAGAGCPALVLPGGQFLYNNTTDRTNRGATYLTSTACRACHPDISAAQLIHGHAHKLTRIEGLAPAFPPEGVQAGVPNPPEGFNWSDIAYVIGGYTKKGRFIDQNGFILTTGLTGKKTQWNLRLPALGRAPEFVNYEATAATAKPYDFACFECHTTGARRQDEDNPFFQENRPGFIGTWEEAGVHCEACHGPGSNHIPNPAARDIFVDSSGVMTCRQCHHRPFDSKTDEILASGGFIQHHEQWPELKASGGHSSFACTVCHDPHRSVTYDRAGAIRNECTACHQGMNMALHKGKVFVRGDYTEALRCESCHMPYVTRSAANAAADVVGAKGRMGDTRTHIFRISTENKDFSGFFTADGKQVARDADGKAAVTVDFVCLRCHNEAAMPNLAFSVARASEIAAHVHDPTALNE